MSLGYVTMISFCVPACAWTEASGEVPGGSVLTVRPDSTQLHRRHHPVYLWRRWSRPNRHGGERRAAGVSESPRQHPGELSSLDLALSSLSSAVSRFFSSSTLDHPRLMRPCLPAHTPPQTVHKHMCKPIHFFSHNLHINPCSWT